MTMQAGRFGTFLITADVGNPGGKPEHPVGFSFWFWCHGCKAAHVAPLAPRTDQQRTWKWDGNQSKPTLTPAQLYFATQDGAPRCHSHVVAGNIHFLSDTTHALANKIVPMVAVPDFLS